MKVVCGRASQNLGSKIAKKMGLEILPVDYKTFPDGEQYVKLEEETEEDVVLVQSIDSDSSYVNLLLLLDALHNARITAVIPYFGYARQDKKFEEGEAVSARAIARTIDKEVEEVLTIDVHDEGIGDYFETADFKNITAFKEISNHIEQKNNQFVVAPDHGALKYAETLSIQLDCEYDFLVKERKSENDVEIEKKDLDVEGKEVVVVDDIVSTGGTMSNAIELLKKQDPSRIKVVVTHPVFANNAIQNIYLAGADEIMATDTIERSISSISVCNPIVEEL
ncbi:ribose-phosphate diphosphokinase [archaeon SCG-AAA382B04]|nr:ribose-phosphate diphosphokinase [archaeon SCG-AAA382B04]